MLEIIFAIILFGALGWFFWYMIAEDYQEMGKKKPILKPILIILFWIIIFYLMIRMFDSIYRYKTSEGCTENPWTQTQECNY
jgi:peptidoglycan biosynthesis protein MviN/MurJ (putative lipid II flippase)